jgi:hypothetical protein
VLPARITVWYHGLRYTLDLERCRRALVAREVEGIDVMESVAKAAGVRPSTASLFFAGHPPSLAATLRILAVLRVGFHGVARLHPEDGGDDLDGWSGVGVQSRPEPRLPELGTAVKLEATG